MNVPGLNLPHLGRIATVTAAGVPARIQSMIARELARRCTGVPFAETAHLCDIATSPPARPGCLHQAPALACVPRAVVENPAAVRACLQPRPRSRAHRLKDGHEEVSGGPCVMPVGEGAVREHGPHVQPADPRVQPPALLRAALHYVTQVVAERARDRGLLGRPVAAPGQVIEAIRRHPGVVGDEPAVQQGANLLEGARRDLSGWSWLCNHENQFTGYILAPKGLTSYHDRRLH